MDLSFRRAAERDAPALAALELAIAQDLTNRFGRGRWSSASKEPGVLRRIRTSHVLVALAGQDLVATLTLATGKPWAIDRGAGGCYGGCGYREVGRKAYRGTPLVYFELLLGARPGNPEAP